MIGQIRTIRTTAGETFSDIARRTLGDDTRASDIAAANPGVLQPIPTGSLVSIPTDPYPDANPSTGVEVRIGGSAVEFYIGVTITSRLDGFMTVEFSIPFDPDIKRLWDTYRPLTYQTVEVRFNSTLVFSGVAISIAPKSSTKGQTLTVSAYSRISPLNECSLPASAYPMSFEEASLKEIIDEVTAPFALAQKPLYVDGTGFIGSLSDFGASFREVAFKPGKAILPTIVGLAKQRGLLIRDSARGGLIVFRNSTDGESVAKLIDSEPPVISVSSKIDGQKFFSHISGFEPVDSASDGASYTVKAFEGNRFHSFEVKDSTGGDLKSVVENKVARMYYDGIQFEVELSSWVNRSGGLWRVGDFLELESVGNLIRTPYKFQIRSVSLNQVKNALRAKLILTIPKKPERLPWDE